MFAKKIGTKPEIKPANTPIPSLFVTFRTTRYIKKTVHEANRLGIILAANETGMNKLKNAII